MGRKDCMRKKTWNWHSVFIRILLVSFSAGPLLFFPVFAESIQEKQEEKDSIDQDLSEQKEGRKDLQQSLDEKQAEIDGLSETKNSIVDFVKELDGQINQVGEQMKQVQKQIQDKQSEISENKRQISKEERNQEKQYESMKKRIQFMYENGNHAYIELFLKAESMGDFLNRAEYAKRVSDYDRRMLNRLQETVQRTKELQNRLRQEESALQTLQAELSGQQKELDTLSVQKQQEVKHYETEIASAKQLTEEFEAEIATQDAEIERLESEAAEAAKEMEAIEAAEAERRRKEQEEKAAAEAAQNEPADTEEPEVTTDTPQQSQASGTGAFQWPCPSSTRVTSDYGSRMHPVLGVEKFHNGIDIGAAGGSDIVAADSGNVTGAGYNDSMGNYVMISHGNGIFTVYMHASALYVSGGHNVSKGERIAAVGSTGRSTGNHLHFSVRVNGAYVSPWNYL